ncbi:MAG: hypothetical protein ACRD0N_12395 [Acidimicrobiales bacterium]
MDEVERRRFLDTLRTDADFRATVRRELLTDELLNLPQTVTTLIDVVAQQRQDFAALAQDFAALATAVHTYMERTIRLIGEGFAAVRARFEQVDERFDQVDAEVSALRTATQAGFAAVDARLDQVDTDIRDIKDRLAS